MVSLALNQKLPKSISKNLNAGRRGKISLVMKSQGLTVEGRYSVSPTDGRLAVTSRWERFIDGAKLRIGSKLKVKIFRCRCDMLAGHEVRGCLVLLSHEPLANAFVVILI